ncbi:sugar phosphate isomerase/epimerase [Sphingomonas sp. RP10(2022)]|uniref:Sugar phosphate isomerase/epimerase n=1 Tax=Sphingomonas liriopis TaxID=2949094 RepID=A0A9X2HX76_9SPHN|nr:sugar phosphate isomerase/epimerase [Sphingomonas liriopis]MCP3735891.1 sugar phosphate isomerase/epimerase [Sphingomonas liriopis]
MPVLPAMPPYDLTRDSAGVRDLRHVLRDTGVTVDLVYPFTMTGRTIVADFEPALAAAAELGAPLANVLCYDREPQRRVERLGELAALAAGHGIALAVEFYAPSQVASLVAALDTVAAVACDGVGVTLDLLHLMRAGEWPLMASRLADPAIRIVQVSDGPGAMAADRIEWEAGLQRWLPGEGGFPIAQVLAGMDASVPVSVEVPQQSAIEAGIPMLDRVRMAVAAMTRAQG